MPEARNIPSSPPLASVVTFSVKIDGQAIPRIYVVKSITIWRQVNKIPKMLLSVYDGSAARETFSVSNEALFVPGKKIALSAGYNSQEEILFTGIIIKHSVKINNKESVLQVEAADEIVKMTLNPKRKVYNQVSDSEVIKNIAAAYSINTDIELSGFTYNELMQYYATDWDYIQTRAEAAGKLCFCENGTLVVKAPPLHEAPVLQLVYGATIQEFNAEIDARYQYSGVQGLGWNSTDQELTEVAATAPAFSGPGNLSASDLAAVAQADPLVFIHGGNMDEPELQNRVDIQLLKSRLAKIRGTVKISGFAGVMPGNIIALSGVGDRFSGNVLVSGVRHEISGGLWQTSIQFGLSHQWFAEENNVQPLPASGATPGIKGLQLGIVTDLENDPEGNDRIKVKIPVVDNAGDGIWCKMSMPDAGKDRGFYFRPEIGDEVVIGFLNEDPNYGVVLGGLNSAARPAPLRGSNDNHEKGLVTRSQMKWIWNDDKKSLTIETPAGNTLSISDDAGEIKLQDQHGNKIVMNSDGIHIASAKDIKIKAQADLSAEAGKNAGIKANMGLKAEGSASAEMKSSGTTAVKGSMVMIN